MGKASVSNITVSLGFVVVPKALAMARLSAAAILFAIRPLSSSLFLPRPPTATLLSPPGTLLLITGWHPTPNHRRAPYCYSPAGTLLLIVVSLHALCPVAPLAIYPSDPLAPPRLRLVVVYH